MFGSNECSFVDYIEKCLNYIKSEAESKQVLICTGKNVIFEPDSLLKPPLPPVSLIIDLGTILFTIDKSDILSHKIAAVKRFYINSVILLSMKQTLQEFKKAAKSILTVLLSPFEDEDVNRERSFLQDEFPTNEVVALYENFLKFSSNFKLIEALSLSDKIKIPVSRFIEDLKKLSNNITNTPNCYYSLAWYTHEFGPLLTTFVLWTNVFIKDQRKVDLVEDVSTQHFNLVVSNDKSNNFTDFLEQLILDTNDSVNVGRLKFDNRKKRKRVNEVEFRYLKTSKFEENWGGRNKCYKEPTDLFSAKENDSEVDIKNTEDGFIPSYSLKVTSNANLENLNYVDKVEIANLQEPISKNQFESIFEAEEFDDSWMNNFETEGHPLMTIELDNKFSSLSEDVDNPSTTVENSSVDYANDLGEKGLQ